MRNFQYAYLQSLYKPAVWDYQKFQINNVLFTPDCMALSEKLIIANILFLIYMRPQSRHIETVKHRTLTESLITIWSCIINEKMIQRTKIPWKWTLDLFFMCIMAFHSLTEFPHNLRHKLKWKSTIPWKKPDGSSVKFFIHCVSYAQ